MTRTIGTINTERGLGILKHCDESGNLTCSFQDGTTDRIEWQQATSWRKARKYVADSYANAYHDFWVLCLRPVAALKIVRSEDAPLMGDIQE